MNITKNPTEFKESPMLKCENSTVLHISSDLYLWKFIDEPDEDIEDITKMWNNASREIISRCMQGL